MNSAVYMDIIQADSLSYYFNDSLLALNEFLNEDISIALFITFPPRETPLRLGKFVPIANEFFVLEGAQYLPFLWCNCSTRLPILNFFFVLPVIDWLKFRLTGETPTVPILLNPAHLTFLRSSSDPRVFKLNSFFFEFVSRLRKFSLIDSAILGSI